MPVAPDAGLADHASTHGSTTLDLDNDGDSDIITIPSDGPPIVYRNDWTSAAASISIIVEAERPTSGLRVILRRSNSPSLLRHVEIGGGYSSFNSQRMPFGLGANDAPETFELALVWPDDSQQTITGVHAGYVYRLTVE